MKRSALIVIVSAVLVPFQLVPPSAARRRLQHWGLPKACALLALLVGTALVVAPAAAQWTGMPVWNDPKGGTGITISGEYGRPDSAYGKGNAWGGRAALGVGTVTLTAGVATYKPENYSDRTTAVGGQAAFRVIGGSLLPFAVNLQVGAGTSAKITSGTQTYPKLTTVTGAVGLSVLLPTPGVSIEPYFSPGVRYLKESERSSGLPDQDQTKFGYALGANLTFGMLGLHLAYDYQKRDVGSRGVFGVGAHLDIRAPGGF